MGLGRTRWELAVGLLASAGAVALVTAAVEVLKLYVPVLSLGVLYVFAVLPVALLWGVALGAAVSVASMLAFNGSVLPPEHTFHLRDTENWAVLAVYLVTAFVVSALAARARRRAELAERREREAAVLAEVAGDLLAGSRLPEELERVAGLAARVLGVPHARIVLGAAEPEADERAYALVAGERSVGTLLVPAEHALEAEAAGRFLPALASLLAVEIDRTALEAEALEAEALRRSDAIKTAVLHSVSHDLRSPLTAIVAAASGLANPEVRLGRADRDELVLTIRAEADRLDRLVGNLLDLSRLRSGAVLPHVELWPVDEPVGRAVAQPDRGRAAPASDWRSRAASPRRTAPASGPRTTAGRDTSCSPSRPPSVRLRWRERRAHFGGRRRAADPAGAAHEPARRRVRGRDGGDGGAGAHGRGGAPARRRHPRSRAAGRPRHGRLPRAADVDVGAGDRSLRRRRRE